MRRSSLCRAASSSSRIRSRHASKAAKPLSRRCVAPRSSQTVALRQGLEEAPVVADDDDGRAGGFELGFEAFDRRDVEMVGGLVEQENVGLGRKHAGERRAPALAAREPRRLLLPREPKALEQIARPVRIVARRKSRRDEGAGGGEAGEIGLLRQIADGRRRLNEAAAAIRLDETGGDLEQRRFARAVPPDETEPLARRDRKLGAVEQRGAAEGEMDVLEQEERRRHGSVIASRRLRLNRRCRASSRDIPRG